MTALYLILLVLAVACFAAAAFGRGRFDSKVTLLPLGLFFWALVPLLQILKTLTAAE